MLLILLVSRSLTRPLSQLAGAAEDIAAGNYSSRVGITGQDEIGMLGAAFDRMAEAVERARQTQRDFLANVSHELKTPLTSLIGFSQALVDGSLVSDERAEPGRDHRPRGVASACCAWHRSCSTSLASRRALSRCTFRRSTSGRSSRRSSRSCGRVRMRAGRP